MANNLGTWSAATNEWTDIDPRTRKDTQWKASDPSSGASTPLPTTTRVPPTAAASSASTGFPTSAADRKRHPVGTGVLDYFPLALMAIANCSWVGNEQHNPGEPLHWARGKSTDQADCLIRHFMERGTVDSDGVRHSAKMAWRALALLQEELEAANG